MAFERTTNEATLRDYKQRMLRVLLHIQHHLDDPLSLDELAGVAYFSPYHFHRVFKGMIGETVKGHIRRLRLERAAGRLKLSPQPVTRIAFEAGYDTHEAFTRAFKAAFGLAPLHFRSANGGATAVPAPSGVHYREGTETRNFKTGRSGLQTMNVQIKRIQPMRVAFMRHVGPYSEVGATWDRLLPILGKEGFLGGDAAILGVCYDDPEVTPPEKIRYDACVTVDEQFAPAGDVGVQTIPGGDHAVTTHIGPYHTLGKTYARLLGQWLPRSACHLGSSPCFEIYLNDPGSTAPEDLITDIYVPLLSTR